MVLLFFYPPNEPCEFVLLPKPQNLKILFHILMQNMSYIETFVCFFPASWSFVHSVPGSGTSSAEFYNGTNHSCLFDVFFFLQFFGHCK